MKPRVRAAGQDTGGRLARVLACGGLVLLWGMGMAGCNGPTPEVHGVWRIEQGPEGPVWVSDSEACRAEVDPARGRLVHFGPRSGPNLLNRPPGPPSLLQFGGHRIWLGPQTEWKSMWPPPAAWEMQPAARVSWDGAGALEVATAEPGGGLPALVRSYRWRPGNRLECSVSWSASGAPGRQSIQIAQLAGGAVVAARAHPTPDHPRGYIRLPIAKRKSTETVFEQPEHVRKHADLLLMHRTGIEEKLGFPVQVLEARWPGHVLRLHPGAHRGREVGDPDAGFRSHVYLGPADWPVWEIEQLSPRLLPEEPGGWVGHTVELEWAPAPASQADGTNP